MRIRLLGLFSLLVVAACAPGAESPRLPVPSTQPPAHPAPAAPEPIGPGEPGNAMAMGTQQLAFADIAGWAAQDHRAALDAFRKSCRAVLKRVDTSGLTQPSDWRASCAAAETATNARSFFESAMTPVRIGTGEAFVTGYYEPEIKGSRTRGPDYLEPIYAVPSDLVRAEQPDPENPGQTRMALGRLDDDGEYQLYWDREAIAKGILADRGLEIAWAHDPIELFFLHIQGSGRLRLPDGEVMRIGYAGQNGREYVGIGRRLREMNALAPGEADMQGIMRWLRANPEAGRALMHENKSYIFFQELTGDGPLGAMGVPVTPEVTLAADPRFVPLGAPVFLETRYFDENRRMTPFSKLMVAQDTGGAIKGANRFDLFWGAGERARTIAGGLSSPGSAVILLPDEAVQRLARSALAAD